MRELTPLNRDKTAKGSGDKLQAATEWLIVSFIGFHTPYMLFPHHSAKVLPFF